MKNFEKSSFLLGCSIFWMISLGCNLTSLTPNIPSSVPSTSILHTPSLSPTRPDGKQTIAPNPFSEPRKNGTVSVQPQLTLSFGGDQKQISPNEVDESLENMPRINPEDAISYISWSDPNEDAFTIDVPKGWVVSGGMFHLSPVQPRTLVEVVSPDKLTIIVLGDKDYPTYTYGNVIINSGFKEGDPYSPYGSIVYIVKDYIGAKPFAKQYVEKRWGETCQNFSIEQVNTLSDLSKHLTATENQNNQGATKVNIEIAEVVFSCSNKGKEMSGYFLAKIKSENAEMEGVYGIIWWLDGAAGFLTPLEQRGESWQIMTRMYQSVQINWEWVKKQLDVTKEVAKDIAQQNEEINNIISENWTRTTCHWGWLWRCTPTPSK